MIPSGHEQANLLNQSITETVITDPDSQEILYLNTTLKEGIPDICKACIDISIRLREKDVTLSLLDIHRKVAYIAPNKIEPELDAALNNAMALHEGREY